MAYYAARSDIEDVFGVDNVAQWADLDNDQDPNKISARIDRALQWATGEIDSYLRRGPYDVPVVDSNNQTPQVIKSICADLAGVWLYESRGIDDFNPETGRVVHRLEWVRQRAYRALRELLSGVRRINAVGVDTYYPAVVTDEEDSNETTN